jgi:Flp pilus assembly protein TadD
MDSPGPDDPETLYRLGLLAHQQGRNDTAIDLLSRSLRACPSSPAAHFFLGRALQSVGRLDDAADSYRESIRLNPAAAAAHNNLGDVLLRRGRLPEAEAALREAVRLKSDFPEAHCNLGLALATQGRWQEATAYLAEAIRHRPPYALAHYHLAYAYREMGRFREALASLDGAIRHRPDYAEAHRDRGMVLLLLGDWPSGWAEYEWRCRCETCPPPPPLPRWDGTPFPGRTLLLQSEQGVGDTLQFVRYASLAKQRGGNLVLECHPSLTRLLAGLPGADRVVAVGGGSIQADLYVPMPSLPGVFQSTPATVPAAVPYLTADSVLVESWRAELAPVSGFKVGIAWQGNPAFQGDRWRSVPLAEFAPVASVPSVRLFSLQKELTGREQLPPLADRFGVTDLAPRLSDFAETAAVMRNLDLVITSDTSVAHLAGALGVPVWMAVRAVADWRWLLEREDSPWYPTMRIFRQPAEGDWRSVFNRIAAALFDVAR